MCYDINFGENKFKQEYKSILASIKSLWFLGTAKPNSFSFGEIYY